MLHQKQTILSRNCAVFAVNNLLQHTHYTPDDFHELADSLHILGPTSGKGQNSFSTLIVGNFSIEVINAALTLQDCYIERFYPGGLEFGHVDWHKEEWKGHKIRGVFINKPWTIGDFSVGRHWLVISRFGDYFVNLDSLLDQPVYIDASGVNQYLENFKLSQSGSEPSYFFLVLQKGSR